MADSLDQSAGDICDTSASNFWTLTKSSRPCGVRLSVSQSVCLRMVSSRRCECLVAIKRGFFFLSAGNKPRASIPGRGSENPGEVLALCGVCACAGMDGTEGPWSPLSASGP